MIVIAIQKYDDQGLQNANPSLQSPVKSDKNAPYHLNLLQITAIINKISIVMIETVITRFVAILDRG